MQIPKPSYPTRSLKFLSDLEATSGASARKVPQPAKVPLKVIISGAGVGGLATAIALARRGHKVTVIEQAAALGEVGAGIQMPSNSTRILLGWGLGPYLGTKVIQPDSIFFRRWESGNIIGHTRLFPETLSSTILCHPSCTLP